jgi:diguanylate cyclase (GGDEF)-like protein/PAS domain S-box-containing protein
MGVMRALDQSASSSVRLKGLVDEERRRLDLRQLGLFDAPSLSLDRVIRIAGRTLGVPVAVVSLVDESTEWAILGDGRAAMQLPRETSFAARVVDEAAVQQVADATQDPRLASHHLVTESPRVRACLGVPLRARGGQIIGALCAMDTQPREFTAGDVATWGEFAGLVQDILHARELAAESEWLLRAAAASEEKHAQVERRLQRIADSIPALIGYWNTELRCEFANDAYRAYSGLTTEQMIGRHFREVLGERLFAMNSPHAHAALTGEPQRFQRRIVNPDGKARYTEGQYLPDRDETGAVRGFFVLVTDVTELTEAKGALELSNAQLLKESTTDFLTGLANRRVFSERSDVAFKRFCETGEGYALILLDLDDFKHINDSLGHEIGDRVLNALGEVLIGELRGRSDLPARLGGEEFAVLCQGSFTEDSLFELAGRIRNRIRRTAIDTPKGPVSFTSSFGIACSQDGDNSWTAAFARADSALYEAKETGKDRIVFGHSTAKGTTGRFRSMGIPPAK